MPIPTVYGNRAQVRADVNHRQKLKSKWDKKCKFSEEKGMYMSIADECFFGKSQTVKENNYVRLLDEGVVVDSDDFVYAVIKKGAIKRAFDSIPDNFVGVIDKDHNRSIELGSFTKKDLKLVEKEDGRYAIDVNVKLDHDFYATKDLIHANNRFAISVEFWSKTDEWITYTKATGEKLEKGEYDYLVPVIDNLRITGYGVVGSPKNANSYDEDLLINASAEEGNAMTKEELKAKAAEEAKLAAEENEESKEELSAEESDEAADETAETAEEAENTGEAEDEAEDGESEGEEADEGDAADEGKDDDNQFDAAAEVEKKLNELKAELAEKDAKIAELEAKLNTQTKKELSLNEKLAKMLNFSTEEPTEGEGAETTSEKEEGTEDAYGSALADAFKSL